MICVAASAFTSPNRHRVFLEAIDRLWFFSPPAGWCTDGGLWKLETENYPNSHRGPNKRLFFRGNSPARRHFPRKISCFDPVLSPWANFQFRRNKRRKFTDQMTELHRISGISLKKWLLIQLLAVGQQVACSVRRLFRGTPDHRWMINDGRCGRLSTRMKIFAKFFREKSTQTVSQNRRWVAALTGSGSDEWIQLCLPIVVVFVAIVLHSNTSSSDEAISAEAFERQIPNKILLFSNWHDGLSNFVNKKRCFFPAIRYLPNSQCDLLAKNSSCVCSVCCEWTKT